jgi:dienelactone hydrolase
MNQTNTWMRSASSWDKVADSAKIVVVYPQSDGARWDLSANGNDVKFFVALIDTMAKRHNIDRNRVYETGFSMGGMMSYALTCAVADKFAAVAPASGYLLGGGGASNCNPKRPMPILHMHGTGDDFVAYADLPAFLSSMRAKFKCPATAQVTNSYQGNSKLKKEVWAPCDQGSEMVFIHIEGQGHDYNDRTLNETKEAWDFMKRFTLGGSTGIAGGDPGQAAVPRVTAGYSGGILRLRGGTGVEGVEIRDSRGRLLQAWESGTGASLEAGIPMSLARGAIYLVAIRSAAGLTILRLALP